MKCTSIFAGLFSVVLGDNYSTVICVLMIVKYSSAGAVTECLLSF